MMSVDPKGLPQIEGVTYVCEVPRALGKVTKLKITNDKVTAETESGITMIVPTSNNKRSAP